jgi:Glycosyl transferase family 2
VTVIVPARDEAAFIEACVGSIMRQHVDGGLELIVVDGRSSDATAELARRAGELRHLGADPREQRIDRVREDRRVRLSMRDPQLADEALTDHVVKAEQRRVDRVAAEDRPEREHRRVALIPFGVQRLGDQPRAAEGRHLGDRVGERRVQRVGAVSEGVHRRRAQPLLGQGDHQRRVGEDHVRPHEAVARLVALGEAVDARHLCARERRRQRRHPAAAHGDDRLGDVDHPPAADRDEIGIVDVGDHPGGDLVHRPERDVVEVPGLLGEHHRRHPHRPLGGQQLVALETVPGEDLRRVGNHPGAKVDRPLPVAPGEVAVGQEPGVGLEPTHSALQEPRSTS